MTKFLMRLIAVTFYTSFLSSSFATRTSSSSFIALVSSQLIKAKEKGRRNRGKRRKSKNRVRVVVDGNKFVVSFADPNPRFPTTSYHTNTAVYKCM